MAKPKKFVPGFHEHITCEEYYAEPCPAPALTASGIGLILDRSPLHFYHAHPALGASADARKSTALQYRGSLVHRLALDKGADFEVVDANDWRTNAAKDHRAAIEAAGKIPVLIGKMEEAEKMAEILRQSITEACDGQHYETEVVIAWQEEGGIWCRSMLDVWCEPLCLGLDLKTCGDASDPALDRAFAKGYARQGTWYRRGLERIIGAAGKARFRFLFVEGDEPYASRNAEISEGYRHGAEAECLRALDIFRSCLNTDSWPSYPDRVLEPPAWTVRAWINQEMEDLANGGEG